MWNDWAPALTAACPELELARGADTLSSAPPLFALCEPLRILDLTGCAHITDETVRGVVTQAPRLSVGTRTAAIVARRENERGIIFAPSFHL